VDLSLLRNDLVLHYVKALEMRRKAHIAAALVDGKHPCQNAQVPGGMTTKPSRVDLARIQVEINDIRTFINTVMIPDLVTVGVAYHIVPLANAGLNGTTSLFLQGYGCGNLLAYGAFPIPATAATPGVFPYWNPTTALRLFVDRSVTIAAPLQGAFPAGVTDNGPVVGPNEANILEHVLGSSKYSSPSQLHPSVGQTTPDFAPTTAGQLGNYTWHKAPRFNGQPHEVGPLARLVANAAGAGNTVTVNDSDLRPGNANLVIPMPAAVGGGNVTIAFPSNDYTSTDLVVGALTGIQAYLGIGGAPDVSLLMSVLGRHAARVLEAKYLADAIGGAVGTQAGIPMLASVITDPDPEAEVYNYQVMPKAFKMGRGMTEAPRGALGHWITTEFRRISNYQAVVPSTWNACGRDDNSIAGPIEQVLQGTGVAQTNPLFVGTTGDGFNTTADEMVNRVLRAIHPFDICVACSVHMIGTNGKDFGKFNIDPDGKVTKVEVPTEA
jgi:hydrogenase large subunit